MQIYTNLSIMYRLWISFIIGVIVGIIGAIIRLGWEILFPLHLQEKLGEYAQLIFDILNISPELLNMNYVFTSGYELNILYILWHFSFSVFFAICYNIFAEFWLKLKFAHGIFYGIVLWICIYILFLPLVGFVSLQENNSYVYYISSFLESLLWVWIIELTRRDLRNRMTQELDPL